MQGDHTEGSVGFAAFLKKHEISHASAARQLGTSGPTIHSWKHGLKRPGASHRRAIERWTNGEVAALSWDTAEERACADRVIPYAAESGALPIDDAHTSGATGTED